MTDPAGAAALRERYFALLRDALTGLLFDDPAQSMTVRPGPPVPFDRRRRERGQDWPERALTMIGAQRLLQLQRAVEDVIARGVPGDFIETGVWRGGACILMKAVADACGDRERQVWLADSFDGLPPPDAAAYPADRRSNLHEFRQLAVPLETVRANFARYGVLDERVRFAPGWFRDTLAALPIERLAILRLDGDRYESTLVALRALHDRVSPGGYVIVDDYGILPMCRSAVEDFRAERGIRDPLVDIDGSGVYWRRGGG